MLCIPWFAFYDMAGPHPSDAVSPVTPTPC